MAKLERYIADQVRERAAYHVPAGVPRVKLDAMESPYGLPIEVRDRWLHALRDLAINRYPAADHYQQLKTRLAAEAGLAPGCGIVLGNGSDEILQNLLLALSPDVTVMAPTPTFVMYEQLAGLLGRRFVGVPLKDDFGLDVRALKDALIRHAPALLFLAYPNNPTGILYPRAEIEELLTIEDALIVIDEAYYPFAQTTVMDKLATHPQLMVLRTLSKQGLAGMRFGWLAADPLWTHELEKVRLPYNINSVTVATIGFALDYADVFADQARRIREERARLFGALDAIATVWPSEANFLLFRPHKTHEAGRIHRELEAGGILIKNLSHHPDLAGCLRVTVGTPGENQAFLAALAQAL